MAEISREVRELVPEMVALRRALHREPELAFAEARTAARVAAFLADSQLDLRSGVGGTGVVATVEGGSGPTVLLRVDMDALPIQEQSEAEYVSRSPGLMHACGHDGHTAMGAVAARILARRRPRGRIRIVFQPAEEGEGGAQAVVGEGVMDGVDRVLGVHLWNELPVGTLGVKSG